MTAADLGLDPRGVLRFLDAVERRPDVEPHALVIRRHGEVVVRSAWAPYDVDRPGLVYSLSKSFTSTAAGFAVQEGLFAVDDDVHTYFPEYVVADERMRRLKIRHLLSMSTGHTHDTWDDVAATGLDPVEAFLALPPDEEPGSVFEYNQPATYTLAAIIARTSGQSLSDFLQPRLFEPLEIAPWGWFHDRFDREYGFSGLFVSADAIGRLGQLYLDRGQWQGRRLLDPAWVDAATSRQIATDARPHPDWQRGYGYQFWMSRHGYRGDGAYGQFCIVLPEQDAVVVITTATLSMQGVLDEVWTHLVPALSEGPDRSDPTVLDSQATLQERLASAALPSRPGPAVADFSSWHDIPLVPRGGICRVQQSLTGVRIELHAGRPVLVLDERGELLVVPLDIDDHTVVDAATTPDVGSVPMTASVRKPDDDTLRLQLRFMDTPHTLTLILSRRDRTFRALWPTIPLHGVALRTMRRPSGRSA